MYAKVYLPISLNKSFSYIIPSTLETLLKEGDLVKVPFGKKHIIGYVDKLVATNPYKGKIKKIDSIASSTISNNPDIKQIIDWMHYYYLAPKGIIVKNIFSLLYGQSKKTKKTQNIYIITDIGQEALQKNAVNGATRKKILKFLLTQKNPSINQNLYTISKSYSASIKTLIRDKYITIIKKSINYNPLNDIQIIKKDFDLILSNKQDSIYQNLKKKKSFSVHLIHGITGSGKTAIYLKLVHNIINNNKSVLILVPEIILTPQIAKEFKQYFGDTVGIWHSKMSNTEKEWTWANILNNKIKIIIGTRSAVYLPINNLSLVIVDEEHDGSYKQTEKMPTYNSRDIAIMRSKLLNIPVILGSATPSIESYYNAQSGKYNMHELMERYGNAQYPKIELIDMFNNNSMQNNQMFSKELIDAMRDCLDKKEQIILLHNRRGYATILFCNDCGYIFESKKTSVPLTYHKFYNQLICHHTDERYPFPKYCAQCKSKALNLKGIGTERIENEIKKIFSNIKVLRLDADTTSKKNQYKHLLENFQNRHSDILIGTQMVSKGFNFHNVTLVGVINSDIGLFTPDFRSGERIFQLLYQVCGRSGRGSKSGKAIIQTFNINDLYIRCATMMDTKKYYNISLADRLNLNYPPFSKVIRIILKGPNLSLVEKSSHTVSSMIKNQDFEILGPTLAPIEKINNNYRYHLIIKTKNPYKFQDLYLNNTKLRRYLYSLKGVRYSIDVDPISLL